MISFGFALLTKEEIILDELAYHRTKFCSHIDVVPFSGCFHWLGWRPPLAYGAVPNRRLTIDAPVGPRMRQIGMRQRLALVAIKQHDVSGLGLGLAQLEPEPHALDLSRDLPSLQRVPVPPPEVFFRSALESCDGPISTCSRFLISAMRRGIVQFARFATGASSNGAQTRSAASVFTGGGPAYTLALMASTPPRAKSPRQKRTVSSCTRNTWAIRALLQPTSVSNMARARSALKPATAFFLGPRTDILHRSGAGGAGAVAAPGHRLIRRRQN